MKSAVGGLLEDFRATLEGASSRLAAITEAEAERRPAPGKWSKKEIIGHLIDSAANNHGRFVRVQLESGLRLPGYEQDAWVAVQHYQDEPWSALVNLWRSYNEHLLHVVARVPSSALGHRFAVGESEPVTLEFLMNDYVAHLEHHLAQIFD